MDAVEVDGLRVVYERVGRGPVVVLLYGYVGDATATWHRQLETLADELTVLASDAPGAGQSADPPVHFGIAGCADWLAGLLVALNLSGPHLVGLSISAALASAIAARS